QRLPAVRPVAILPEHIVVGEALFDEALLLALRHARIPAFLNVPKANESHDSPSPLPPASTKLHRLPHSCRGLSRRVRRWRPGRSNAAGGPNPVPNAVVRFTVSHGLSPNRCDSMVFSYPLCCLPHGSSPAP